MYCVIKYIVRGNQARVKNSDLRHPSCTVVMYRRKSASPVHNVLIFIFLVSFSTSSSFVCLFSCRYNPLVRIFHSPVAGFSLLVFEVS